MPSQLALIICTLFVLWLLRLERKQTPNVSFVLWLPTIWMLLIASKPVGIWFKAAGDSEGSLLDQAFFTGLLLLGLIILAKRRFDWSSAIKNNTLLILLIGYMLVSILWSETPFTSFKRWVRELNAVVMAFLILSERDPLKALQSIFRRTIYVLIPFSYVLIRYFPQYGRQYGRWSGIEMWIGVTLQKNGMARLCIISVFFILWTLVRRWVGKDVTVLWYQTYVEAFILVMTLYLLGGPQHSFTYSATATGAIAVTLAIFCWLLWKKNKNSALGGKILIVMIALLIGYSTATPFIGRLAIVDVSSSLGRDETLTDRTEIWEELVPVAMQQPIFGHGFGGFWNPTSREKNRVSEAHSGYLDIILDLGFIGLLIIAIFLLSSCRKAQRAMTKDFDYGALWICYLIMTVLHNITESSLNSFDNHLMAVLIFLAVSVPSSSNSASEHGIREWKILYEKEDATRSNYARHRSE
jgi:exopolysaccharide production protein ExoQ